jgi:outer membrane immunogenic protein
MASKFLAALFNLVVATVGLITVCPADAAGLPLKAPNLVAYHDWSGFYTGLGLGARSSVVDATTASAIETYQPALGIAPLDLLTAGLCPCSDGQSLGKTSLRIAPYIGFNWQFAPRWLAGIEGEWGWSSGSRTVDGMMYSTTATQSVGSYSVKSTWDASLRGRLGFLLKPNVLLYTTGGAAWLHLEQTSFCPTDTAASNCQTVAPGGTFGPSSISDSTTRLGWTIGGGVEAMLPSRWILRGEYRYADFGTWSPTDVRTCAPQNSGTCFITGADTITVTENVRVRTHTFTFGIARKFGGR